MSLRCIVTQADGHERSNTLVESIDIAAIAAALHDGYDVHLYPFAEIIEQPGAETLAVQLLKAAP